MLIWLKERERRERETEREREVGEKGCKGSGKKRERGI